MGTDRRDRADSPAHLVSNPLGWDGDFPFIPPHNKPFAVSNPLGWDGDRWVSFASGLIRLVSNPLGWDGDEFSNRKQNPSSRFLIH